MAWIDLETTGLSTSSRILEVGIIITDHQGNERCRFQRIVGYAMIPDVIFRPDMMQAFDMHSKNGLIGEARTAFDHVSTHRGASAHTRTNVEQDAVQFLNEHFGDAYHETPMAGASVQFDRAVLKEQMPVLHTWFHYRQYDVSTLLAFGRHKGVKPDVQPRKLHRSIPDLEDEILIHKWAMRIFWVPKKEEHEHGDDFLF